ncbi:MAG: hypothetical protein SNI36_08405 [Rikenellaceae bacterium]
MKRLHYIYLLFLVIFAVGCTDDPIDDATSEDLVAIDFTTSGSITRSGTDTSATEDLRFSLVSSSSTTGSPTNSNIYTYDPTNSTLTRADGSTGLYAGRATYYLVIATPTDEMQQVGTSYGHLVERVTDTPLYISDDTSVYVDGINAGGSYIYDLSNTTLSQKRSKLLVKFKSDLENDRRTVNTLYIKDLYTQGYASTPSGVLFNSTDLSENNVSDFTNISELKNLNHETYTTATTSEDDNTTYIISSDYSAEGATHPTLVVGLKSGDEDTDTREIDVPLDILMEPHACYTYSINISSIEIEVTVTVNSDWDKIGITGTIETIAKYTVNIDSGEIKWVGCDISSSVDEPEADEPIVKYVDFTTEESSNCYILNPSSEGGTVYYIPISRIDDFWTDTNYVQDSYQNTYYSLNAIGNNWEAVMSWHDFNNPTTYEPINKVTIEKGTSPSNIQCVVVTIPSSFANPDNHCNIGYVVRATALTDTPVLWSWHLWITDYDPYVDQTIETNKFQYKVDGGELHRYDNTYFETGIYKDKLIMDRNLGARSPDFEGHGSMTSTTITAPGTIYYQFGRKDPFPAYYNVANGYTWGTLTGSLSLEDGVNNPSKFITTSSGNWCSEVNSADYIWNDRTISKATYETGKSIFDPSPQGFRVPITGTWTGFTVDTFPFADYSRTYNSYAYYPTTGYRIATSGALTNTGSYGYSWSATPYSYTIGYYMNFNSTTSVNAAGTASRAHAFPIRPIQE